MNPSASFLREDQARTERWAHLTEGVKDSYQKKVLETLLDNQQGVLGHKQFEATDTSDVAIFTRIAKPLIRRLYPALVANQLVSIQPMSMPTGKVFYMDFKYSNGLTPTAAGDRNDYEAGKFNKLYASGAVVGQAVGTGDGAKTAFTLPLFPIKPGSLVLYKDSVSTTSYTVVTATGVVTFTTAPANGSVITADYQVQMEGLGSAGTASIPELELEMSASTVDTESKKIKAKWTVEAQQDLDAYHGLSAEGELTKQLADEIRREIDRMIIDDLYTNASAANVSWSKTIPGGQTAKEWYETLVGSIGDVSNEIYKKRLRHANFVVMGPDTANLLDKVNSFRMSGFTADAPVGSVNISGGPNVFGTLTNRYTVIVDPLFAANKILVGYKGDSWMDTGYVYAPYTAFNTQTFVDPNTMTPVKGLMTRFGRHLVNGDFYGTVTVTA